ncbi:MAG: 5'-methylthioadenosine/S-adenosylhomocysteine nucleosidase [Anaerolineaceae bacterium]|nr:5'-methylthioadenosine/S-adenosylhomocysteine nucleosidase [Anaerolineaceae bacterium]
MRTIVIIFSSHAEWRAARKCRKVTFVQETPFGECFALLEGGRTIIFLEGGWGKISAAASVQYAILHWSPDLVINLGTCGGLQGKVERGDVILAERTLVYDLIEQMGDQQAAYQHYTTELDLSWLPSEEHYPQPVQRGLLLSADRDILAEQVAWLQNNFGGVAADWESGAIAWVCSKNKIKCLILRGVSDLVSPDGGEAYGNIKVFHKASEKIIANLLEHLPAWLDCVNFS